METLSTCPSCGSRRHREIHAANDAFLAQRGVRVEIRYAFCGSCSLVFANPRMTDAELGKVYNEKYWESAAYERSGRGWRLKPAFIQDRLRVAAERFHILETRGILNRFSGRRPAHLDIGSGAGFLPAILKKNGWEVQGVEPTPLSLFARKAGVPTRRAFFDPAMLNGRKFDLISMMHVFEHIKDPVPFLGLLRASLRPGGVLWLEVPDLACPRPVDLVHPHVCFYSANTIASTLARAGFRVLRLETYHSRNAAFQVLHVFAEPGRPAGRARKDSFKDVRAVLRDAFLLHERKRKYAALGARYGAARVPESEF